jgi:hypothetical protein
MHIQGYEEAKVSRQDFFQVVVGQGIKHLSLMEK